MSRGVAHRGISAARVAELGDTWKRMTVYRLPDNLLGIVLRG
nr:MULTISPECIES: hypothetical protein [Streptomyces]